ncbi:MAG TPA: DUF1707 domain-containing protein [Gammaproteobacteria bacterium]
MAISAKDRPLETLRSETIDRLIMNYGHGRLSLEAFERRLDQAFEAERHEQLESLTADLDLEIDERYLEQKKRNLGLREPGAGAGNIEHVVNVFSAGQRGGVWEVPEEIRVITVFGATDLDFSNARFTAKVTRVKLFCLFGAVDIFVRDNVSTTVKTFCTFGAVENNVPATQDPDCPRLIVEGLVLFGAADAKIKRTFKERLLDFAATVRAMFAESTPAKPD